ncbi:hypothetical protein EIP86_006602 [Pleurotus ostreatoroseus]|nr:hypothetical protein EIP86_006602 [Pleurotus ostreatoroseus]
MTIPEPALRNSVPIRVTPRCGMVGCSDKVEWRLMARPLVLIASGVRVTICDALGVYRHLSRTVGPVVGADSNWVTFLLSPGLSSPVTVQTLTVPRDHAELPLLLRFILFLVACYLANEHPFVSTPLPDLD